MFAVNTFHPFLSGHTIDCSRARSLAKGEAVNSVDTVALLFFSSNTKVQEGKDQEKAQSERDSHSKNRGGKKPN